MKTPTVKILVLFLLIVSSSFCQFNPGAKQIGMANSDVALGNDAFTLFTNPAGLSQMNWRELGIFYSPAPFGVSELANGFMAFHEPTEYGSFAFGAMSYGFELYRENKFLLGYSYKYLNKYFIGLSVGYHTVSIKRYGDDNAFILNLGGLIYIFDELRWGFALSNVNRATWGKEKDQIPVLLNSGFSYDVINNLSLNLAVEKEINYKPSLQFGVAYNIVDFFGIRTGFSTEPDRYCAGVGINYSYFQFDYSVFHHAELGFTHQFGLLFSSEELVNRGNKIREYLKIY